MLLQRRSVGADVRNPFCRDTPRWRAARIDRLSGTRDFARWPTRNLRGGASRDHPIDVASARWGRSIPLPGTTNALSPFFSPDSQWIAFFADGSLKKVPVAGGPAVTICAADDGFGGSWASDNTIVFAAAPGSPLSRVPSTGGVLSRATTLEAERGEFSHRWPEVLPECQDGSV